MEIFSYPDFNEDTRYLTVRTATELGSLAAPRDLRCRWIWFIGALEKIGDYLGTPLGEVRLEFRANSSGFNPGLYIFEFNGTNPIRAAANPPVPTSPCKYKGCLTWYSKMEPYNPVLYNPGAGYWTHENQPLNQWQTQYDYRTTIPTHQIANPMKIASVVNLTLDDRLHCGRDDRPLRRSAIVIGFSLNRYRGNVDEILHIRAPIGWLFDSDCTVWTAPEEVYPPPAEMPATIALLNNTPELPVYPWPNSATILSCRGDGHQALLTVRRGLREQRVYLFRIEIKQNPATTPISNTWSLTFGDESSGAMPGFPVWTFPGVRIEPVLLAWTNKSNPVSMPVAIFFETTNWLYYYNPVTTPLTDLPPILRIVMPAQYEFLVAADDQDMQGERCFLSMQQEGSCRLCGVPFQPSEAWCVREWNRKNAATIYFAQSKIIEPGFQYSVWVIVTNPHSPDALDGPRSTWVMETFFGRPVPPATIPEGYFLDYVVAPGYRVSGLSELTVETPEARDGGSFVDWVTFTMNFPDLLLPGDRILIRAPPGFQMSFLLPGFELVVLCYGFRWLPTIWPPPLPPDVDPDTIPQHLIPIRPPQRPPVPEGVPTWASGSSVLEIQPTNLSSELQWAADGAWVMRMPINFTAAILSDFEQFLLLIESNASNFSNLTANDYVVPNAVELMQRIGLPSWAVPAAARSQIQTQGNETVNASTEYLVLRSHCLDMFAQDAAGNYLNDDFNWSKVPLTADTQVWYDFHSYVFLNGSVVSSDAENFNYTNYTIECDDIDAVQGLGMKCPFLSVGSVDTTEGRYEISAPWRHADGRMNKQAMPWTEDFRWPEACQMVPKVQAFYDGAGVGDVQAEQMTVARVRFLGDEREVFMRVEAYRREYEARRAVMSREEGVEMHIQSTELHPDPQPGFINPRRPPLDFENNWIMLHNYEASASLLAMNVREVELATPLEADRTETQVQIQNAQDASGDLSADPEKSPRDNQLKLHELGVVLFGLRVYANIVCILAPDDKEASRKAVFGGRGIAALVVSVVWPLVGALPFFLRIDQTSQFHAWCSVGLLVLNVISLLSDTGGTPDGAVKVLTLRWFNRSVPVHLTPLKLEALGWDEKVKWCAHAWTCGMTLHFISPRFGLPWFISFLMFYSGWSLLCASSCMHAFLLWSEADAKQALVAANAKDKELASNGARAILLLRIGAALTVFDAIYLPCLEAFAPGTGIGLAYYFTVDDLLVVTTLLLLTGVIGPPEALKGGDVLKELAFMARAREKRIAFPGQMNPTSQHCIVSFPGKYAEEWDGAVRMAQVRSGAPSLACVFLTDEASGLGKHAENPERPGECWCQALYGSVPAAAYISIVEDIKTMTEEELHFRHQDATAMGQILLIRADSQDDAQWRDAKREAVLKAEQACKDNKGLAPWGCVWFEEWKVNVSKAVDLGQKLHVFYFENKVGEGKLAWDDLANETVVKKARETSGLGASQTAEVAYLQRWGYGFEEHDVSDFFDFMQRQRKNVLRPTDPAIIHFEFVTVNPADSMEIQAAFPIGFDFTNVYLNSIGAQTMATSRLTWVAAYFGKASPDPWLRWHETAKQSPVTYKAGGIELRDGYRDTCELRVNFDKNEYVRFELGGILIPWTGGQALFNMHTSIGGFRQDEIELCCHEGEPPENPAHVFKVPYRLQGLRGVLMNEWMQQAFLYPIASSMKTRLGEEHLVSFTFMLASEIVLPPRASVIRVIVRAPLGYGIQLFEEEMDVRDSAFLIEDPTVQVGDGLRMRSIAFSLDFRDSDATQIQLSLPGLTLMRTDIEYRIMFMAVTPGFNSMRIPGDLWVIEITDDYKQLMDQVSEQKGSLTDFELLSKVNFSCEATRAPPEVVIVLEVTLYELGEAFEYPNRVDVYAPAGYKFLLSCFAPGERQRLQFNFVSCRERWTLFQGNYLSGAILMAADAGVLPSDMPMKIRLQALTPPLTPAMNDFFVVTHQRQGDAAWGLTPSSFPVSNMQVTNRYTGVAGAEVPMFLAFTLRYPLAWGGNIHIAGPLLYQIRCPISLVLLAPDNFHMPNCTHEDTVLNGCFGLPIVGDPNPNPALPLCDPLHEILLTWELPWWAQAGQDGDGDDGDSDFGMWALQAGDEFLWSLTIQVPFNTPTPRSSNVFRVRVMDANKVAIDGNLWLPGQEVRTIPRVQDFKIWFTTPVPATMMTVAIHFTFNLTLPRGEEGNTPLRVIEIEAPQGMELKVRRPADVRRLRRNDFVAVTEWNWTDIFPQQLWFGLDTDQNVSGTFHYAFPALTPTRMPVDNLWQVKLCTDSPFCTTNLLTIPIPGFFFGQDPDEPLSEEAQEMLQGSWALRSSLPSWSLLWLLMAAARTVSMAASER
ncbi:unnamed protein product [Symbiodinium sp. CCMP2592]|nr:unnamed protein product [Symbiodinium sp. CCMP2592]